MVVKNIFICYRREDAEGYAGRLQDRLNFRFPNRVFRDITGISPGADYTRVIQEKVGGCSALIAIIGNQWLTIEDDDKRRRLFKESDYVRREIATALTRNITVIPVLVRDAKMPTAEQLPPDLQSLSFRNAVELSDTDFDYDVARLIRALEAAFGEAPVQSPPPAKASSGSKTCLIVAVIAVLLGGIGLLLLVLMGVLASNQTGSNNPAPAPTMSEAPVPQTTQAPADDVVIDFEPSGTWTLQVADYTPNTIEFHDDFTYQATNGGGSWQYLANEHKLILNGLHVDLTSGQTGMLSAQIMLEGKSGNQFVGRVYIGGQVARMSLTPQ